MKKHKTEVETMADTRKKSPARTVLKIVISVILALIIIVLAYLAYVLIAYHRIDDNVSLDVSGNADRIIEAGEEYTLISYNIGFAAYTPDFGFFMDGGDESRAASRESVLNVMDGITGFLSQNDADIYVIEEVDFDSDRSYHVDEREIIENSLVGYSRVFAQNYDSPYLFYPFTCPHGASKSGILTLSKFPITSSLRRSLPIEESLMKLVDLDRCYSVSRIPAPDGKELVVFSAHLSAYTSDGKVSTEQVKMLVSEMQAEYEKGNYVIAAGDFNKDLIGKGSEVFGVKNQDCTWALPLPDGIFDGTNISLSVPFDENDPVPSCRNADGPYNPEQYVITPDGFIVSDNITVTSSEVMDMGFIYSDHNPVRLTFILD